MSNNPPIDRAVEVAESFDEKGHQLSTSSVTAFGIELTTRYSKCNEMIDMLQFAQLAAQAGAASLVKSLFYDSKAAVCSFEWHGELDPEATVLLRNFADSAISHYCWTDGIVGGKFFADED